jgi:tetratricopeptide (TPR) repeat protein
MQLKEPEKALNAFNQAIKIKPSSTMYLNRGKFYISVRRFKEALEDINMAIDMNTNYMEAYETRAGLWLYMAEETDIPELKKEFMEKSDADFKLSEMQG